ncbi:MAG: PilZ domain-containing protein [Pyrinomonadaceae bacterium]
MTDERRKYERKDLRKQILLEFMSGRRQVSISDIGMEGCYVDSIAEVVEGEMVSFDLTRDATAVRYTGNVAYVLPGMGFGIRFSELTAEQRLFLAVFMNS